jgi:hypothetical protein
MTCNLKKLLNVIFHTTLAARHRQKYEGKSLRKVRRRAAISGRTRAGNRSRWAQFAAI